MLLHKLNYVIHSNKMIHDINQAMSQQLVTAQILALYVCYAGIIVNTLYIAILIICLINYGLKRPEWLSDQNVRNWTMVQKCRAKGLNNFQLRRYGTTVLL